MKFSLSIMSDTPPIVLLDLLEEQTLPDYEAHITAIGRLVDEKGWQTRMFYLIVDSSHVPITFSSVVQLFMVHNRRSQERGAAGDPLMIPCFVGGNKFLKLASEFLTKASKIHLMLLFSTREEAIEFFEKHYEINAGKPGYPLKPVSGEQT